MSNIPDGICVDLETTIAGKVPDDIRPSGQKRYETRILEVGAVKWKQPEKFFGCIVNPIPMDIKLNSVNDLYQWLESIYQKPDATINFWSRVLVMRENVSSDMFRHNESPLIWLRRTPRNKAIDFVHWHNHPSDGPNFVSEEKALRDLIVFGNGQDWLAHNGNSFDFKILEGCALRTGLPIPSSIRKYDTLKLFRKMIPGYKSYSQPKLYDSIFSQKYNAHVAIDDAKALSKICRYVDEKSTSTSPQNVSARNVQNISKRNVHNLSERNVHNKKMNMTFIKGKEKHIDDEKLNVVRNTNRRRRMNLIFKKNVNGQSKNIYNHSIVKVMPKTLSQIKGIGPKSVAALAAVSVTSVAQLKQKIEIHGEQWLRDNLPFGVKWREVSRTII